MFSGIRRASLLTALAEGRGSLLVLLTLLVYFWAPALWDGKLLIHGDSAHHGLTLFWLHGQALAGHDTLLWSNRIFGGHPLFAEGQGGFANPLNILSAWLFEPVRGFGVVHFLSMATGGGGVFCLCRVLGISRWPATFAAIAVVFSSPWVASQHNLPMSMTQAWIPWLIAATEYWLKQPSLRRAVPISGTVALMVFGGYPQLTHAAVLYVLASLVTVPFRREGRIFLITHWRACLVSSMIAVILAIGLSAIQLLPLFELVGESKRSAGIGVYFNGHGELGFYLKGLLYFYLGEDPAGLNLFNLASIVTMLLASLAMFFRTPSRTGGHLLAAFLLFNLGAGYVSPLFYVIYDYHLIPGLHYFRSTYSYIPASLIGLAVAAAAILDVLSGPVRPALRGVLQKHISLTSIGLMLYGGGFAYLCFFSYAPVYSKWYFLAPTLIVLAFLLLSLGNRRRWLPACAVLILAGDAALLHTHEMVFHDRKVIEQPDSVRAIIAEPDYRDYHVMDTSPWGALVFWPPTTPGIENGYRRLLAALNTFPTGLQWRVPSINGSLALPLRRRELLDPLFEAELKGARGDRPGLRLLDIYGIRYISSAGPLNAPGLSPFWQDPSQYIYIYRNAAAKPRFQVYWQAREAESPEQALTALQAAQDEILMVEKLPAEKFVPSLPCITCAAPHIEKILVSAMRYKLNVTVDRDAWLFLADANYPGWQATVNGVDQPVYTAQVLGKAVHLSAGRNEVVIRYVPWSFYIGATLSGASLLLALFLLLHRRCKPQTTD
ncbi:MAG TPA: YfhO family protein [Rhodocyclaceae bacterium]|nr:YfhO family protein [Rhodocyclaceae bacterium]